MGYYVVWLCEAMVMQWWQIDKQGWLSKVTTSRLLILWAKAVLNIRYVTCSIGFLFAFPEWSWNESNEYFLMWYVETIFLGGHTKGSRLRVGDCGMINQEYRGTSIEGRKLLRNHQTKCTWKNYSDRTEKPCVFYVLCLCVAGDKCHKRKVELNQNLKAALELYMY